MERKLAAAHAEKALETVDRGGNGDTYEYVGNGSTIVVGRDSHGYWVADNGEETNGLDRTIAKAVIIEALAE